MEQSPILQRFWERALNPAFKTDPDDSANRWREEVQLLESLGIAMEAALQFLYFLKPGWEPFKQWLLENKKVRSNKTECIAEDVLSAEDLAFWEKNGYLVLKNAVSKNQCFDAQNAIWEFLQARSDDPCSWYKPHEGKRGLMLMLFDHPALEANRQSARIRNAYRQLYVSDAIHKTIDKVSFNPPEQDGFRFLGNALHWDVSLALPISFRLQGLLYLTDCAANEGAFHCVPGFHHHIGDWLNALPPDADPRQLAPQRLKATPVPAKAGDFIIWHQALPHCATPNYGKFPRMVQYLSYLPDVVEVPKEWR